MVIGCVCTFAIMASLVKRVWRYVQTSAFIALTP
jgi:hypothetical protein